MCMGGVKPKALVQAGGFVLDSTDRLRTLSWAVERASGLGLRLVLPDGSREVCTRDHDRDDSGSSTRKTCDLNNRGMVHELDITACANWPSLLVDDLRSLPPRLSWWEGFERVLHSCERHMYTRPHESRSPALTLCSKLGVSPNEPVRGVAGDDCTVLVVTDRRLLFGEFNPLDGGGLERADQIFHAPHDVRIVISRVWLQGHPPPTRRTRNAFGAVEATAGQDRLSLGGWLCVLEQEVSAAECTLALPGLSNHEYIPHSVRNFAAVIVAAQEFQKSPARPTDDSGDRVEATEFQPRLIRSYKDAEIAAADWLKAIGLANVRVTPPGADGGVDVVSDQAVAQVKAEMVPIGRPVVQQVAGIASVDQKHGAVFSLAGFTQEAATWADVAGVSLFRFDLQGIPEPMNRHAKLMSRATTQVE